MRLSEQVIVLSWEKINSERLQGAISAFLFVLLLVCSTVPSALGQPPAKVERPKYFSAEIDSNRQRWYGNNLYAMNEPPIWDLPKPCDKFIFRLLWLRSFHHPICVRIERNKDGTTVLFGKELNGAGGYAPGNVITNRRIKVSDETFNSLMEKLKSVDFFSQPTIQDSNASDGAQWIFEVNDKGQYHIVDCFGGRGNRDIGIFVLKEAGLLPDKHVY